MKKTGKRRLLPVSILLLIIALVFATAATVAWMSISDNTRLYSMSMDISAGTALRFDLDPHADITGYRGTLSFGDIADRIMAEQGFDPRESELTPVTTVDCETFTLRNGTVKESSSGSYLEFTLHFMAAEDMIVHLTSANSRAGNDGTHVSSAIPELPPAMRISFSVNGTTVVYDPGIGDETYLMGESIKVFGLPSSENMMYNNQNSLFSIKADTDLPVTVRIWMEGTDDACTDLLKGGDYSIRLRFEGTDEFGNPLDNLH